MDQVDLSGGWSRTWSAISGPFEPWGPLLLTSIAIILALVAFVKYIKDRRSGAGMGGAMGGGSGVGDLGKGLILPACLAAPSLVGPIVLTIADAFINALISIANSAGL